MSFVRRGASSVQDAGVRPGSHGHYLVSTGSNDLDELLNGGLPLGTLTLVLEDGVSKNHLHLLRYFVGEGVACQQAVLCYVPSSPANGVHAMVPAQVIKTATTAKSHVASSTEQDVELRIAWQYKRYAPQQSIPKSSGSSGQMRTTQGLSASSTLISTCRTVSWAHAFDLTKDVPENTPGLHHVSLRTYAQHRCTLQPVQRAVAQADGSSLHTKPADVEPGMSASHSAEAQNDFTASVAEWLQRFPSETADGGSQGLVPAPSQGARGPTVGRLALQSLGSPFAGGPTGPMDPGIVFRQLFVLKALARDARCAVMVTLDAGLFPSSFEARAWHLADVVLRLQPLHDDNPWMQLVTDPNSCCGLFRVEKYPAMNSLHVPKPPGPLQLLRWKARRLRIEEAQVAPDKEFGDQGGTTSTTSKSVSAVVCGGPSRSQATNPLEF